MSDAFEGLVRLLMERRGYWMRGSFKVELTREEKRGIDESKSSIPRPEIDLLAFDASKNQIIVLECKSYLDSPGVRLEDLAAEHEIPSGRYKLFTCEKYREVVFARLRMQIAEERAASAGAGPMVDKVPEFVLGLAAGKTHRKGSEAKIRSFMASKGWYFFGPSAIARETRALASRGYENDPYFIAAKMLMRSQDVGEG